MCTRSLSQQQQQMSASHSHSHHQTHPIHTSPPQLLLMAFVRVYCLSTVVVQASFCYLLHPAFASVQFLLIYGVILSCDPFWWCNALHMASISHLSRNWPIICHLCSPLTLFQEKMRLDIVCCEFHGGLLAQTTTTNNQKNYVEWTLLSSPWKDILKSVSKHFFAECRSILFNLIFTWRKFIWYS